MVSKPGDYSLESLNPSEKQILSKYGVMVLQKVRELSFRLACSTSDKFGASRDSPEFNQWVQTYHERTPVTVLQLLDEGKSIDDIIAESEEVSVSEEELSGLLKR